MATTSLAVGKPKNSLTCTPRSLHHQLSKIEEIIIGDENDAKNSVVLNDTPQSCHANIIENSESDTHYKMCLCHTGQDVIVLEQIW